MYVCMYIYICTCVCVYIYTYTYTYTYISYSRPYHVLLRASYEALTMCPNTTVSVFVVLLSAAYYVSYCEWH